MSNKLLIIIAVVFLLMMGIMGTGFFFMWTKLNAVNAQTVGPEDGDPEAEQEMKQVGPIYPLETFIVNLADEGGNRYLRVTMRLELKDEETVSLVEKRLPLIRNSILMLVPTKKYADINTVEGKVVLRDEMIAELNANMTPGSISNIYFTEFVIQ